MFRTFGPLGPPRAGVLEGGGHVERHNGLETVWAQILTEGGASVTRSAVVPEWSRQRWKCTRCSWSGEA
eukprot:12905629-Prorocentrum_lima.AAC.1